MERKEPIFKDKYGNEYTPRELVMLGEGKREVLNSYQGKKAGDWEDEIAMEIQRKQKAPAGEPRQQISENFLNGFVFVRDICGAIFDNYTNVLLNYCEEQGLDFDEFIEKIRKQQEKNNGRPPIALFSEEVEKEFAKYTEECCRNFPFLRELLL